MGIEKDWGHSICEKEKNVSGEVVRNIISHHNLQEKLLKVKFGGRGGNHDTPVPKVSENFRTDRSAIPSFKGLFSGLGI